MRIGSSGTYDVNRPENDGENDANGDESFDQFNGENGNICRGILRIAKPKRNCSVAQFGRNRETNLETTNRQNAARRRICKEFRTRLIGIAYAFGAGALVVCERLLSPAPSCFGPRVRIGPNQDIAGDYAFR